METHLAILLVDMLIVYFVCLLLDRWWITTFFLLFPCWKPAVDAGNDTNENREGGGWWGLNSEVGVLREKALESWEELHSWMKTLV